MVYICSKACDTLEDMTLSLEFGEALRSVGDLGLNYHLEGEWAVVSLADSRYPGGVEIVRLRRDMGGFERGVDFGALEGSDRGDLPKVWENLPGGVIEYLSVLDGLGLRLVARGDELNGVDCFYIATDGFVGGDNLGGENHVNPSLVLAFDQNGTPWRWGVYKGGQEI